jgi:chromosome segregation ATPase
VLKLSQEHSKLDIEINIANSRIKELEGIRDMNRRILQDIYAEKRDIEKENKAMEEIIEKQPETTGNKKFIEIMAVREKERQNELESMLGADRARTEQLLAGMNDEEEKSRKMLEDKTNVENELKLGQDDLDKLRSQVKDNDDEIIRLENLRDSLTSKKQRLTEEFEDFDKENTDYTSKNEELEKENEELEQKIKDLNTKIDLNNLLKEVNMDDLKLAATNSESMNSALLTMIRRWDTIEGQN